MKRSLTLVAISCMVVACATPRQDAATLSSTLNKLESYQWELTDARDYKDKRVDDLFTFADQPITITFKNNKMTVSNTCNTYTGTYLIEDSQIVLQGNVTSLKAGCKDKALMKRDVELIGFLRTGSTIEFKHGDPAGMVMTMPTHLVVDEQWLTFAGKPLARK